MDIYRSKFGKRLREARKRVPSLSQERFAELVGVEGASVSRWETGKDFPDESRLPKICEALGVSVDYFEQPEQIVHQDPLPEWAKNISERLKALESNTTQIKSPARGYHLDPPSELGENWPNLDITRQMMILYLATKEDRYKRVLGQTIVSRLEAISRYALEARSKEKKAR